MGGIDDVEEREEDGEEGGEGDDGGESRCNPPGAVNACSSSDGQIAAFFALSVHAPVASIRPVTIFNIS